eukprot:TRINITY_DN43089_c0_g1_i3.p1 TRINITY_DN43089_c0_g1~~TRINITY_DN43089_c0_g1_i3.p1  ORF type:complete len:625 (+),score=104.23 TRINITY_DN43089_c0_g1_i3:192-2066(+)
MLEKLEQMRQSVEQAQMDSQQISQTNRARCNNLKDEVARHFEEVRGMLERREAELLREVDHRMAEIQVGCTDLEARHERRSAELSRAHSFLSRCPPNHTGQYTDLVEGLLLLPPARATPMEDQFCADPQLMAACANPGSLQSVQAAAASVSHTPLPPTASQTQVFGTMREVDPQREAPSAVAVHPETGDVYVTLPPKNVVCLFSAAGDFKAHLGEFASDQGPLDNPCGVFAWQQSVLVSDTANHRVAVFDTQSKQMVRTFGGQGTGEGKFRRPMMLCVTPSGNVVVADSDNRRASIWELESGRYLCSAGGRTRGKASADKPFRAQVQAVCATGAGDILVADTAESSIRVYRLAACETSPSRVRSSFQRLIGPPGVLARPAGMTISSDADQGGLVLVCDGDRNCVSALSIETGQLVGRYGTGMVAEPWGIAVASDGSCLLTEHSRTFARRLELTAVTQHPAPSPSPPEAESFRSSTQFTGVSELELVPQEFRELLMDGALGPEDDGRDILCAAIARAQLEVFEGQYSAGSSPFASPSNSPSVSPFETPRIVNNSASGFATNRSLARVEDVETLEQNMAEIRFLTLVNCLREVVSQQEEQAAAMQREVFVRFAAEFHQLLENEMNM